MSLQSYVLEGRKVIMRIDANSCASAGMALQSSLFREVIRMFCDDLIEKESAFLDLFGHPKSKNELYEKVSSVISLLAGKKLPQVVAEVRGTERLLKKPLLLYEMVQELYNFWRNLERFLIYSEGPSEDKLDPLAFIKLNEDLKSSVIDAYRSIVNNITGQTTHVYRQLPAGANIGLLTRVVGWDAPKAYKSLKDIPFITLSLLEPPVIFYPRRNVRKGGFVRVEKFSMEGVDISSKEWLCYPAKVGTLVILIFFHQEFISLGSSLANLFELATENEIAGRPDGILIFGMPPEKMGRNQSIFYEDDANKMAVGVIGRTEDADYFGYFKKMALTLHNVIMMRRGSMPVHGAMAEIVFRNGKGANICIVGDSGAGKSESLEAFRTLAEKHIRTMNIIFDDMGSLKIREDGKVLGFGTEIGAFVRLDDLQPGYAFGQIDRSMFMNPHKINARVVIPITTYPRITKGIPIDLFLYANNYEKVDKRHSFIDMFDDKKDAIKVFREGKRAAKGTTDEKGLVGTFFSNPFGPEQLKKTYGALAEKYFEALFQSGTKVGQLRTRLGIKGFEQKGPESAAEAIFKFIEEEI